MFENKLLAQVPHPLGRTFEGLGPLGTADLLSRTTTVSFFNKIVSTAIGVMTVIAGLWFVFQFILGGFNFLTAGGDKSKTQEAQKKITNAAIGIFIVVAAMFIVDLIGRVLGLEILSPGSFILSIW
ncbi:hypothetical protein ACFL0Y_04340 [Patescibacteria group bacterium]